MEFIIMFWSRRGDLNMVMEKGEERTGTIGDAENVVTSRRDEALRLREAGLTYAQIAHVLGVSKQRARQIVAGPPKKPDLDSKQVLRVGDVAQLLGLHPNTVRRWSKQGLLKSFLITKRGDRRFRRKDIDDFLEEVEKQPHEKEEEN